MTVSILLGDVRAQLRLLPDDHFDCVVTSPPYWAVRDYDADGQMGLEPTAQQHIADLVAVFREVRRVLKPTGCAWVNYGDSYATTVNGRSAFATKAAGRDDRTFRDKPFGTVGGLLKSKDMLMLPQRLFIALQEDGWWVRSVLPWVKRSAMPETIHDRPANALEHVGLLTKSARYFYNPRAVRRDVSVKTRPRGSAAAVTGQVQPSSSPKAAPDRSGGVRANRGFQAATIGRVERRNFRNTDFFFDSIEAPWGLIADADGEVLGLDVLARGFGGAHFATFPPAFVEPLLRATCPPAGRVLDPFGGAGTTALVAERLGLDSTLIELKGEYAAMAMSRIANAIPTADIVMGAA